MSKKKKDDRKSVPGIGKIGDVSSQRDTNIAAGDQKIDQRKVTIKEGTYIEGDVNIKGGDFVGGDKVETKGVSGEELLGILEAFTALKSAVEEMPESEEKEEASNAVEKLRAEAEKGDGAEEKRVNKWFKFLLDTAPDIFEVAVDTFTNPVKGVSTIFQKVAKKAREEKTSG